MRCRIFNIMQYELHPETKEPLIDESKIKKGLRYRTIKRYAYIKHNKDVYSEKDELNDPNHVAGTPKPDHWHIVIETGSSAVELSTIAKWFEIPENYIDVPKGHGAFLDCVEYLTHESEKQQELGKHKYEDEEVIANFDFRKVLNERQERRLKYGKDLTIKDQLRYDVLKYGKTLVQCQEEDPVAYSADMATLKRLRLNYLDNKPVPKTRINFYVSGRGGIGKGLCSKALARSLYPDMINDDEIFFPIGAKNATFEGYDGQPVIIWNDFRASELLDVLGGRGNVFSIFDTHPTNQRQNIKYGSINLCNKINIINSVDPYIKFLKELAGSEDKNQSYRRVPFIINVHESEFDFLINKGFMFDTSDFEEYIEYKNIQGNLYKLHTSLRGNDDKIKEIEKQMLELPIQKIGEIMEHKEQAIELTDELLSEFEDYGKQKQIPKYDLFD